MAALNTTVTGRDDWTTATFDVAVPDGETYAFTGMVRLWFGVHKRKDGWWRLTHLPTGYAIGEAATEGQLVRTVAEIKSLIDWNFSTPDSMPPGASAILRPALDRHNARLRKRDAEAEAA